MKDSEPTPRPERGTITSDAAAALPQATSPTEASPGPSRAVSPPLATVQALRESERRFRLLAENSPDAVFLHDMDGAILEVNQRACAMLDYDPEELRRLFIHDVEVICPPEELRCIWRDLKPGPFAFDGLGRRKDGSTFPTEVQGVAFLERGKLLGLVAARDVTARKEMERNLEQARDAAMAASRAKSEFLANVSHEIRTPLNILLGMTDLLRETPLADRQRQFVDSIENAGNLLLRLINDILDLSRIEADRIELLLEPVDVRELLRGIAAIMRPPVEHKGLTLSLRLAEGLPERIRTDPSRVQQVLMNLLWNAIKFTPSGGILLGAECLEEASGEARLRFYVLDTGIGIATAQQVRIFEPFTQADASTRRRHGGTGLGLAISRRLVGLLGGSIQVESQPGQGSCFSFTLPLEAPEASSAPDTPAGTVGQACSAATGRRRLLLVEDSLSNQEIVKLFLEDEPFDIVTAGSGAEALALFSGQAFDLVLMDVEMPGMDGCEATAAIRALERERDARPTPVLMLTAHAFCEYERRGREAGCDGFLSKPIRKVQLIAELRRLLAGPA